MGHLLTRCIMNVKCSSTSHNSKHLWAITCCYTNLPIAKLYGHRRSFSSGEKSIVNYTQKPKGHSFLPFILWILMRIIKISRSLDQSFELFSGYVNVFVQLYSHYAVLWAQWLGGGVLGIACSTVTYNTMWRQVPYCFYTMVITQ